MDGDRLQRAFERFWQRLSNSIALGIGSVLEHTPDHARAVQVRMVAEARAMAACEGGDREAFFWSLARMMWSLERHLQEELRPESWGEALIHLKQIAISLRDTSGNDALKGIDDDAALALFESQLMNALRLGGVLGDPGSMPGSSLNADDRREFLKDVLHVWGPRTMLCLARSLRENAASDAVKKIGTFVAEYVPEEHEA